jgi:hypothetical protein
MSDPFWSQEDIASLKAAIASGVLTVRYSGPPAREQTYQSLDQMRELLAEMRQDAAKAAGRTTFQQARVRKGF